MLSHFLVRRFPISLLAPGLVLCSGCQSPPTSSPSASVPVPAAPVSPSFPTQPLTVALATPDAEVTAQVMGYVEDLFAAGAPRQGQGVWMQTESQLLGNYQGTVPLSAASLTKVATTLAALQVLGPNYRFTTKVGIAGTVQQGVLNGDLVIEGGQNPFFVWEDAIALAQQLQQQGIRQVKGNLVVIGPFYMNFETDTTVSGSFLQQGLDATLWPPEALTQYQTLPPGTPKPQLTIAGEIVPAPSPSPSVQWMWQHQSLPLSALLKKMNRYSNNPMAEMIANTIGGPKAVEQKAIAATGVPATEIQLANGSGLGEENRMSPRAVCALFLAIHNLIKPQGMTLGDLLTVIGQDESVLDQRPLPQQAIIKSGTLDTVSSLAGVLPTQTKGMVWFALINNEGNVDTFRALQEKFLQSLGPSTALPTVLKSSLQIDRNVNMQPWRRY